MESYTLSKTNKKPNQKWAKDLNGHFSKKHTNGQKIHEKMLNITNLQGNANQNHNEYHHTSAKIAIIKNTTNNKW